MLKGMRLTNAVHVTASRLRTCLNREDTVGRRPVTAGVTATRGRKLYY